MIYAYLPCRTHEIKCDGSEQHVLPPLDTGITEKPRKCEARAQQAYIYVVVLQALCQLPKNIQIIKVTGERTSQVSF